VAASKNFIETDLGRICVHTQDQGNGMPIVFLHGIYLDSSLWDDVAADLPGHRLLTIDMPGHGESLEPERIWSLNDCVAMLLRVLDVMGINKCVAVGHSWGAMTALHAASLHPERFDALCLLNMPFRKTTGVRRFWFQLQKLLAAFPSFYAKQAAKALYTPSFMARRPEIAGRMEKTVTAKSWDGIARLIDAVILQPDDARQLIANLKVPAVFLVGEEDSVGVPPVETVVVPGGHISPHEAPAEVVRSIRVATNKTGDPEVARRG
jgi:3-oxoadipate enol-lactonase